MSNDHSTMHRRTPRASIYLLQILSILLILSGVGLCAATITLAVLTDQLYFAQVAVGLAWLLAGLWAGAVLAGLARLMKMQRETLLVQSDAAAHTAKAGQDAQIVQGIKHMQTVLTEISTNLMLSPQQLEIKRRQHQQQRSLVLAAQCRQAITQKDFAQAQQHIDRLREEIPDDPSQHSLADELQSAREQARQADIAEAGRDIQGSLASGSFEKALQVARELLEKYPNSPEVLAQVQRIEKQASASAAEKRIAKYKDVDALVQKRQWRPALAAAKVFVAAYPASDESKLINAQMTTLEENAQIEEVRELRDRIRDLINAQRFSEAHKLALDVVLRFPQTAAAEELRPQLDRLARKANEEK